MFREMLLPLFEPSDIGGVRALRWGRNDGALSWQNPSNTGNVPPLLAPANNGHDLLVGSPGASTTPIHSPGSSSTPIYSPGASKTPIYSPGS
ncbi:hypothetical protein Tco_0501508, partial [Tanacetum coccineum]